MTKLVGKKPGSYEILYKSDKNYTGKGSLNRAVISAKVHSKLKKLNGKKCDKVVSISWRAAENDRRSFIEEFVLQTQRGVKNPWTYNKIWSPGKKYYLSIGGRLLK